MFSVICVYNDENKFNSMLKASLSRQSGGDYELIALDCAEYKFGSASQALNYGASLAKGDFLVFAHQDISLMTDDFFLRLGELCAGYRFGMAGVAGISLLTRNIYSSVLQGRNQEIAGTENGIVRAVDTLDECLLIVQRQTFTGFADYGNTWHLYGVEYCLRCAVENKPVLLFPLKVYHFSPGSSLDKSYYKTLNRVKKQYKGAIKIIPTTMGIWRTGAFAFLSAWRNRLANFIKIKILGR